MDREVIIDGVKYVPVQDKKATRCVFYYMNDNHTFVSLDGSTITEIKEQAMDAFKASPYGMLCSPILFYGKKEKRFGKNYHGNGLEEIKEFEDGLDEWAETIYKNEDIARIMGW